jgi:hypothetical protein
MISFSNINKQYGKQLLFVDASFQLNPAFDECIGDSPLIILGKHAKSARLAATGYVPQPQRIRTPT